MFIALVLDYFIRDPVTKFHPIKLIGDIIITIEKLIYKRNSKFMGLLLFIFTQMTVLGVLFIIELFLEGYLLLVFRIIILFFMFSFKTLISEGLKIYNSIDSFDISISRKKLAMIVGRDTFNLDKDSIIRATIETLSENFIDGVFAPMFFLSIALIFNLGIYPVVFYKVTNTLDSMVGYKNDKYLKFGYYSAKIDDLLNYLPARIGSIFILLSSKILGYKINKAFNIYLRDKNKHSSPNAAHSESVIAGLLEIKLLGPSYYFGKLVYKEYIGDEIKKVEKKDIIRTKDILKTTFVVSLILFALLEMSIHEFSWRL